MNINERIREVRNALGYTQIDFGNKIGISQGHLTGIENGKKAVTDKTIKVISLEYHVNEQWLRTGEGEMFNEQNETVLARLIEEYDLDVLDEAILRSYLKLSGESRRAVRNAIKQIALEYSSLEAQLSPEEREREAIDAAREEAWNGKGA